MAKVNPTAWRGKKAPNKAQQKFIATVRDMPGPKFAVSVKKSKKVKDASDA